MNGDGRWGGLGGKSGVVQIIQGSKSHCKGVWTLGLVLNILRRGWQLSEVIYIKYWLQDRAYNIPSVNVAYLFVFLWKERAFLVASDGTFGPQTSSLE